MWWRSPLEQFHGRKERENKNTELSEEEGTLRFRRIEKRSKNVIQCIAIYEMKQIIHFSQNRLRSNCEVSTLVIVVQ